MRLHRDHLLLEAQKEHVLPFSRGEEDVPETERIICGHLVHLFQRLCVVDRADFLKQTLELKAVTKAPNKLDIDTHSSTQEP